MHISDFALGGAILLAMSSGGAAAQTANAPVEPNAASSRETEEGGLSEIVVTATRRAENLQSVPVTVSTATGDQLSSAGLTTTRQLENITPGLVIGQIGGSTQPTIRGVGTRGSAPGEESNVALYLDGIYQPAMSSNSFELLNVERVEVLKGPQGTLFGRNATGGAINIITRKPSDDLSLDLNAVYGSYNEVKLRGYATGGLTETLSFDMAGLYRHDDGYVKDLIRGGKTGGRREASIRSRLQWRPSSDLDAILAISHTDVTDNSYYLYQPIGRNTVALATDPNVLIPGRKREIASGSPTTGGNEQFDVNLALSYSVGSSSLESSTDYQRNSLDFQTDSDGTTVNGGTQVAPRFFSNSFSQELRLVSNFGDRFKYVVGAMYFYARSGADPFISGASTFRPVQTARAYSGFGEAVFEPVDSVFLTGGLRYSYEKRALLQNLNGVDLFHVHQSFDSWTPRASIRYQFASSANVYLTYSKGFKSGLYNTLGLQQTAVRPETITSWEVGLKTEPTRKLRVNISGFKYNYSNLQVQARDANSPSVILQNAAGARLYGVDADMDWAAARGLDLRAGISYLHSRYTNFPLAQIAVPRPVGPGNVQVIRDVSGNVIPRAPSFSAVASGSYEWALGSGYAALGAALNYNDGYTLEPGGRIRQPSYVEANANISWENENKRLKVGLSVENAFDADIILVPLISSNGDFANYRRPRTYFVNIFTKI